MKRAARALCNLVNGDDLSWKCYVKDVHAVLMAIREPSERMIEACGDIDIPAHCDDCPQHTYNLGDYEAQKAWQAMIDVALAE